MKALSLHSWQVGPQEAQRIQLGLARKVSRQRTFDTLNFVAGVDIAIDQKAKKARAAVVVLSYPSLKVEEVQLSEGPLSFPYIPGLLSFREAPSILSACESLSREPDLLMADGQGIAHPRRFGIASHLGLLLDLPTIGCAKSILLGTHDSLSPEAGSYVTMIDRDEIIGAAVRTKNGEKPIYVSIGHRIDLPTAIDVVLTSCRGYRLPEPTRLAHLAANGQMIQEKRTLQRALF